MLSLFCNDRKEAMARTPDYSEKKSILRQARITPSANELYEAYAKVLDIGFSELLEQITRYPSVARGFAGFVESQKKLSKTA